MKMLIKNRLIILYIVLFSINALCTCALASLQAINWTDVSGSTQFCIVLAIIGNWTGTLIAFFNKSWSSVEKGEMPILADTPQKTP